MVFSRDDRATVSMPSARRIVNFVVPLIVPFRPWSPTEDPLWTDGYREGRDDCLTDSEANDPGAGAVEPFVGDRDDGVVLRHRELYREPVSPMTERLVGFHGGSVAFQCFCYRRANDLRDVILAGFSGVRLPVATLQLPDGVLGRAVDAERDVFGWSQWLCRVPYEIRFAGRGRSPVVGFDLLPPPGTS